MSKKKVVLSCQKKNCDGELIYIDGGNCYQRWKCGKCLLLYELSPSVVAWLKKQAKDNEP